VHFKSASSDTPPTVSQLEGEHVSCTVPACSERFERDTRLQLRHGF